MRSRITSVGLVQPFQARGEFIYPKHIAQHSLDALPQAPGIYIFRDQQQRPLYVGKSVNLRARVLSHLRNPEEARMLALTCDITHQCTAGEIGALLLESQLIKQLQPPFNRMLRKERTLCSLQLDPEGRRAPQVVFASQHDFARTHHLFGLFSGKHAALESYRALIDDYQLCSAKTGLEKLSGGRPCFAYQVGRCRGACVGIETEQEHQARLLAALQDMRVLLWPFHGAVGIIEQWQDWRQMHVVDHWAYLGSCDLSAQTGDSNERWQQFDQAAHFDVDTYKILVKPLSSGQLQLEVPGQLATARKRRRKT